LQRGKLQPQFVAALLQIRRFVGQYRDSTSSEHLILMMGRFSLAFQQTKYTAEQILLRLERLVSLLGNFFSLPRYLLIWVRRATELFITALIAR
jgi:hypothetical protein